MEVAEREIQVRRFVDEVWNARNYEAAADLYSGRIQPVAATNSVNFSDGVI